MSDRKKENLKENRQWHDTIRVDAKVVKPSL